LLKLRHLAKDFIKFEVGDGHRIHLWVDNWHPSGILFEKFGPRAVYDAQSHKDAKLSSVLSNGSWRWRPARSDALVEIQSRLPEISIGDHDKPIWTASKLGSYVSAETWDMLRNRHPEVTWWPLVWFAYAIPKQAFILWLVMRDKLTTGERLAKWGYNGSTVCFFCRHRLESRGHLFFECGFSSRIWQAAMARCFVEKPPLLWEDVLQLGCRNWKKKTLRDTLCRLALSSTVYNLWRARNEIKHSGQPKTEEQLLKIILWEVRSRIVGRGKFLLNRENTLLCRSWNLSADLLA
jgi:hypothetical protein